TPYHVYEITNGGWLHGETTEPGILDVSRGLGYHEWFIATTNECMNVFGQFAAGTQRSETVIGIPRKRCRNNSLQVSRGKRLSQLAWCGEGCFDSRRRLNSTVRRLPSP